MIEVNFLSIILGKSPVYGIWDASGVKQTQILEFDSIIECGFEASSSITEYPIENGTYVTDYKYDNPDILEIRGVISRTNADRAGLGAYLGRDELINKTRQNLQLYKSGIYRLVIQTKSGRYDWFTLQDYRIPENYNNYGLFEVEMTFKEIIRPQSQLTPVLSIYSTTFSIGQIFKALF